VKEARAKALSNTFDPVIWIRRYPTGTTFDPVNQIPNDLLKHHSLLVGYISM
jgi:hypothetical protein